MRRRADPADLVGLLADERRLRAFAAVVLGARTTEGVAAQVEAPTRDVLGLLARLERGGLVSRDEDGWHASAKVFADAAAAVRLEPSFVDHGAVDASEAAVLRTFMPHGRLVSMPMQRSKRLIVLDQIARVFEPGRRYAEKDVNTLLLAFFDDYAALRRYLVDEALLSRENGEYWRSGGTVTD